ncbi:hypothetical protein HAX54_032077, partial [Datura stramonium]|nr:hypothetical protein [Datura stramonium]
GPNSGRDKIYTMMTLDKKYFVSLEFLINEGVINSGMFDHFPRKLLSKEWTYERKKDVPKNGIGAAC